MRITTRTAAVAASTIILAGLMAGCATEAEPDSTTSAASADGPTELVEPGTLTACMTVGYKPLEYYENGTDGDIIGFDADGITALAEQWGLEAAFETVAFDGLVPALQSGRCDVLWSGLYLSEERLAVIDGYPYLSTGPALAVPEDAAGDYEDELDLCGASFATQAGGAITSIVTTSSEACEEEGLEAIEIVEYPSPSEAIASVLNGRLDGIIETDIALTEMVAATDGLSYVGDVYPAETQFGAFAQKDSEMSTFLEEGITTLLEDGTFAEIAETYGLDVSRLPAS
jgi:ABC-type amino acid transport substrate-binding protein